MTDKKTLEQQKTEFEHLRHRTQPDSSEVGMDNRIGRKGLPDVKNYRPTYFAVGGEWDRKDMPGVSQFPLGHGFYCIMPPGVRKLANEYFFPLAERAKELNQQEPSQQEKAARGEPKLESPPKTKLKSKPETPGAGVG
jgi:hypothetical protein